ncbi:MAG: glycoside hydrolase family 15 protein [Phycisphaeraceae bacterium]|nr:glycoside hydrolase family 15 protein [Phycisphaerae bacterium]MBX3392774.1 glycoside hydrolase family 15 protein [Phycisphaeraceae bacterium]HRJ49349.1 glycoside hydrolase family 15 protein [Phycisphaerales bacterium]
MPRDIPVGNGNLLVTFDRLYRVRDIYYPHVGRFNHTEGSVQRFGVWADGRLAWIEDPTWRRSLRYKPDTLVTDVHLVNEELELEVRCEDAVDFHEAVFFRRLVVRDLAGRPRDVRIFYHFDLSIRGTPVGDTANYDPATSSIVIYKDDIYFLFNACDEHKCGIDSWAIGTKRVGGAEGTWRDAEDGVLGRNAISQGSVDATIGFNLDITPGGMAYVTSWLACGRSYDDVKSLNRRVQTKGPERLMARTEAYWRLWARKEPIDVSPLPEAVRDLFYRSQLVLRTQIDNGGAIIAANDSDITQFGGDHYSYCWMRDGAMVAYALVLAGQSELSRNFFRYAADAIEDDGYFLHKYTPTGELASSWHPWMLEGQRILPIQQDETSLVVWALRKHFSVFRDVEFVKPLYNSLVVHPANWLLSYRDRNGLPHPSWDLWEERRGIHTYTVAATIGALYAASAFAHDFGESDRAVQFRQGAETMKAAMLRYLWNPKEGRFSRMAIPLADGGYRLDMTPDSANYGIFAFGALPASDPKVQSDMTAIRDRLWIKTEVGGCARYHHDYYHQVERDRIDEVPGNPWIICTLWQAEFIIASARSFEDLRAAIPLLEWSVAKANESGVLAEQFNPHTGEALSVSPLTWSHATFVIVVLKYLQKYELIRTEYGESPPPEA